MAGEQKQSPEASIDALMRVFEQGGGYLRLREVIRQLSELEAADALCAIVEDRSITPSLRHDVLVALSAFPNDVTIALFLDELQASSRKRKQLAIETLGQWRVHKAIPALCEQFRRQKQTALRGSLLEALGRIATPDTLFVIQQWLREAPDHLLRDDLARLVRIPQIELLELLTSCQDECASAPLSDSQRRQRQTLFEEACHRISDTLKAHQQARLSPHRQQLEEALFDG